MIAPFRHQVARRMWLVVPLRGRRYRAAYGRWLARRLWGEWAPRTPETIFWLAVHERIFTAADIRTIIAACEIGTTTTKGTIR